MECLRLRRETGWVRAKVDALGAHDFFGMKNRSIPSRRMDAVYQHLLRNLHSLISIKKFISMQNVCVSNSPPSQHTFMTSPKKDTKPRDKRGAHSSHGFER